MVSESLPIESLYALELAMLRYPGLELERVSHDAITVSVDPDTGEEIECNFFADNLVAFVFRGPRFGELGRPRSVVPFNRFCADEPFVVVSVMDSAVESLERLVERTGIIPSP